MDNELIKKLLAALTQIDAMKPAGPLDHCLDESDLWGFIDSDHIDENSRTFSHLRSCAACLQRVATALQYDTDNTLSKKEKDYLASKNSKIPQYKNTKTKPMHLRLDNHIALSPSRLTPTATNPKKAQDAQSDQHNSHRRYIDVKLSSACVTLTSTNLKTVEGLRSDSSQCIYLTEKVADLSFRLEIKPSEKESSFELFVEMSAIKDPGNVSVELWSSAIMKRSISLDLSKKQNLSRWPKGLYKIIFKKAGNFEHPILLNVK